MTRQNCDCVNPHRFESCNSTHSADIFNHWPVRVVTEKNKLRCTNRCGDYTHPCVSLWQLHDPSYSGSKILLVRYSSLSAHLTNLQLSVYVFKCVLTFPIV
jgi:hypothetical protein